MPESITATVTPVAGQRRQIVPRPPTPGRRRSLSAVTSADDRIAHVARQMIHVVVVAQRVELAGVDWQHRAARQIPLHDQVVAGRQRVDRRLVAVHDDVDRLRAGGQVILQVGAEPRVVRRQTRTQRARNTPSTESWTPDATRRTTSVRRERTDWPWTCLRLD